MMSETPDVAELEAERYRPVPPPPAAYPGGPTVWWAAARERRGHWAEDAACKGEPSERFYAPTAAEAVGWRRANRRLCGRCPVRGECLAEALATPEQHDWGWWGGTTAAERRQLRREGAA